MPQVVRMEETEEGKTVEETETPQIAPGEVQEKEEDSEPGESRELPPEREPFWRIKSKWLKSALLILKDVAIALLIVFIFFLVIWLYSGVWPPIVVVESSSMQHDDYESFVGVIDTGDIVLVKRANSISEVKTYAQGKCSGHSTYGDYGDVIIYNELGGGDKPIIHRALLWLELNTTTNSSFDIPALECGKWRYGIDWWSHESGVTRPRNLTQDISIRVVSGYRNRTIHIAIYNFLRELKNSERWTKGGFVALGDNNEGADSHLIKHEWIIGKARGELPWFGLIKLAVTGDVPWGSVCAGSKRTNCAPENSWTSLVIALVLLIVVPVAMDIGLGYLQKYRERKEEEKVTPEEEKEEKPPDDVPQDEGTSGEGTVNDLGKPPKSL